MSALSESFRCFALDLPGHDATQTDSDDEFEMPGCAQAVVEWLAAKDLAKCDLVGYSMGGRLALYLALNFPERFNRVILESASPGLRTKKERTERRKADAILAGKITSQSLTEFLNTWYNLPLFGDILSKPGVQELLTRRVRNCPTGLAKSLQKIGAGSQPDLWSQLKKCQNRMLLIAGEKDVKYRRIHQEMIAFLPNAKRCTISGASHNTHFEKPKEFTFQLKHFLQIGGKFHEFI